MDDIASFGYWVRRRRKALDLTQVALAQRVGCAEVTIRKIEQDERRPSREMADLLADNLAIPDTERDTFVRMARGEFVVAMASPLEDVSPLIFLGGREKLADTQKAVFVAREHELAQLDGFLDLALSDQPAPGQPVARPGFAVRAGGAAGRVVFVTGEAGSGKTALMREFSRRAQEAVADLIVAGGNCNAYIGEGTIEAELYRLKGEFLRMDGANEGEVEACFHQAITLARRQSAKSWELRATTSLCRLCQAHAKKEEARQMLANIYGWFTEGFGTPDLKEAKALLQTLT